MPGPVSARYLARGLARSDHEGARFPTTRFSALLGAKSSEPEQRERSWEALVRAYWAPVFKHIRIRWRRDAPEAEDLTQAFFARALEQDFLLGFDARRARFRTFLRVCLDRFVSNERKATSRIKRGGGTLTVSMDFPAAEAEIARVPANDDPESSFDREWRRSVLRLSIERLKSELERAGKRSVFEVFERYDLADEHERPTYEALARELGLPPTTVTNQLALARRELRRIALEELATITSGRDELHEEAQAFFQGQARR